MKRHLFSWLLSSVFVLTLSAQNEELAFIATQDISYLLAGDSLDVRNDDYEWEVWPRREPIGYIGEDYKRLRIHWVDVVKSAEDPLVYSVSGVTKVGKNICPFGGHLIITGALQSASEEYPNERIGHLSGTFYFIENEEDPGTGEFNGRFWINYWLPHGFDGPPIAAGGPSRSLDHEDEKLIYNTLEMYMPGFGNNQFTGSWTSYRSGKSKDVAWADYRFSFPTDLDVGASEFVPAEKYLDQGWRSYFEAWIYADPDRLRGEAQRAEMLPWWEN